LVDYTQLHDTITRRAPRKGISVILQRQAIAMFEILRLFAR
jgi:hypothetical protein